MLHVVRPVKLNVHVVVASLKVFVLFPDISVLTHFTILVSENLVLFVGVLDFSDYESDIGVVVVNVSIEAAIIGLVDGQIVMATCTIDLETDQSKGVQLMACLEERVCVAPDEAAKLNSAKVLHHVLQAHKEGTIVRIGPLCELFGLRRPAVRVVTPITLPFEVTPRIPQLNQFNGVTKAVLNLDTAKQTIGVVSYETELFKGIYRC